MPDMIRPLLVGLITGVILSILPMELVVLLVIVILILFCISWIRSKKPHKGRRHLVGAVTAVTIGVIATSLPVKNLDRKVGPMHYGPMTFEELTEALAKDWGVFAMPDDYKGVIAGFETTEPLTRREVLEKLAQETNTELHIGYCGTGASLLFGAHPSFTTLRSVRR